ncbi:MAG: diacylglycerol kinase family protein [Actinobacteria bacterium]|nr:diacylglycerol kinase family protein [Actinomycetota bacterium]
MWLVAINPSAGHGKGAGFGERVLSYLHAKQIAYQVFSASTASNLRRDIESFLEGNEIDGIISVGGDGLAHLILQIALPRNIPFAIVPAGTGNDIVRSLGFSLTDIEGYLKRVTSTKPSVIDLGNVDSEWFAGILSTGFDSVVNERANSFSWPRGPQRYNVSIALELPKFTPLEYQITTDTKSFTTKAMLIAIGNGRSYGGGMLVCPHASMNDGLFDVMILEPVSKVEFLKVFPKVFSGSHITHPAVKTFRTQKITLSADAIAYADGERIGPAPISAECVSSVALTWTL